MIDRIALIIAIIGGINWGSIGLFQFDLVAWICGGQGSLAARIIYTVVGLAAIWCVSLLFRETDESVGEMREWRKPGEPFLRKRFPQTPSKKLWASWVSACEPRMRRDRWGECDQRDAERISKASARRTLTQSGPLPQRPRFVAACLFVTGDELVRVGLVARKMSINIEMTQECASFFIAAHPVASAFPFGERCRRMRPRTKVPHKQTSAPPPT